MDEKVKGIIVTLKNGMSDECRDELMDAMRMLKGVVDVAAVDSENSFKESLVTRNVCAKMRTKLNKVIEDINEIKP